MYLIVNSEYKIVDISNISRYVRRQPNGIVVLCDRADAEAIYSDDHNTYYPIERVGYVVDSHQLVEVDSVPEGIVAGYYYYRDGEYYTSQRELNELARAQQAYAAGAKVSHNGKNWVSTVDNNVWEPGVYGWDEVK